MTVAYCQQTAHLFVIHLNILMYAVGFGIPSPVDVHTVCSNLDSIQHLHSHLANARNLCVTDVMLGSDPFDFKDAVTDELRGFYHAVKQATVTKRIDNAVAGIFAEAAAGATGALISRKSTIGLVRETKKDSLGTKMKSTGAFFGARIGTEGISRILGIPRPLGLMLAAIVGSFVSTTVKVEGRIADKTSTDALHLKERRLYYCINGECGANTDAPIAVEKMSYSWSPYFHADSTFVVDMDSPSPKTFHQIEKSRCTQVSHVLVPRIKGVQSLTSPETMTFSEVAGDICKWMMFDNLEMNNEWASRITSWTLDDKSSPHVLFGSIAAVAGKYVQDLTASKNNVIKTNRVPVISVRFAKTAFEGGVLFGTYKATLAFLNSVVPDDWNKEFLFEVALENVEKILPGL